MKRFDPHAAAAEPTVTFHFLGTVDFDACLALQTRLVFEAGERDDGRIVVLLCEHPGLITIGRNGSRTHVRIGPLELRKAQLETRYVSRGGGCVLHQPGQLAIYPIVPLAQRGWSVGQYFSRLQLALVEALSNLQVRVPPLAGPEETALVGRSGLLASLGVAVRNRTTLHGAWLNVNPAQQYLPRIDAISPRNLPVGRKATMASLLSERHEPVTMTRVRAALVEGLAAAFQCSRHVVTSGHPWLASTAASVA
jgi:lipoyl(octanoyl) transferase